MSTIVSRAAALVVLLAAIPPLTAQGPAAAPMRVPTQVRGLHPDDNGDPLGIGADYLARFAADRVAFVPFLGKAAPHDLPFAWTVTHAGRGEPAAVGPAVRETAELRVDYVRPELRERLEVRADGLKQSFVFASLPPGDGDLVVRVRIASDLRPERAASDGGLRFTLPGVGGVEIAPVVGIDAAGRSATGSMRVVGDTLDFVLPAAFVAAAALPLELDPLIAPVINVSTNAADERQVDAASLPAPVGLTAVVWRRFVSATNNDVFAAFVDAAGAITATIGIETFTNVAGEAPRVAGSASAGNWLAIWNHAGDVSGRMLVPNGAAATVVIANGANAEGQAIVMAPNGAAGRVFVAWLDSTADAILGREVDIAATPPSTFASQTLLVDSGLFSQLGQFALPRTSTNSRALLAFTSSSTVTGQTAMRGLVVSTSSPPVGVGNSFAIAGSANTSATLPAVAGDGRVWVVAYRTTSTLSGPGAACTSIHRNGTTAVLSAPRSMVALGTSVADIDAAWCDNSALLAFSRVNGGAHDVVLMSVDPLNCSDCEGTVVVDTAGNDAAVTVAAAGDDAVVGWVPISGTQGNVALQRYAVHDGSRTTSASGPFGENVIATCARPGRADFGIELHGGTANVAAFALVATSRLDASCGVGGVLVPDLFGGFVVALGNTSATGDVRLQFAIPAGAPSGFDLFVQLAKVGTSCFSAVDLSNALQITLQ